MERLRWFTTTGPGGETWSIYLTTPDIDPDSVGQAAFLGPSVGMTYYNERTVLIDASLPIPAQNETVLHELMHVVLGFHRNPKRRRAEEMMIRKCSPALYPILKRLGFKLPPRPAGYVALRRSAKKWCDDES